MKFMDLKRQGPVWILSLGSPEEDNTLNDEVLLELQQCMDRMEADREHASLIIYSNHPKTWCNGIDLPWLMTRDEADVAAFLTRLEDVLLRLSTLSLPTIACITGNCYAGGALLAAACDFRFMREDRGRFCFSEVKVKLPFTPAMFDIINQLPNAHAVWTLCLTAQAMGGFDCQRMHVVDHIYPSEQLFHQTLSFAEEMAQKHRPTYTTIKRGLRASTWHLWQQRQHPQP